MQWSLEDIYKKQVRGKIPPRRHLRVLGERVFGMDDPQARRPPMGEYGVSEQDFTIFGKTIRDENDVRELNLRKEIEDAVIEALKKKSNVDIEAALRRVEKGVGYITGTHAGPVMSEDAIAAVKKLAEASGFGADMTANWLTRAVLPDYNVNDEKLEKLGDEKRGLTVLTDALPADPPIGRINLHDIVLPQLDFVEEEERVSLYNEVFAKSFEEGKVGVGDGELCLSLFTEAYKGTVGDLQIPDGRNIEVKVGMGRIISARGGKFAADAKELTRLSTEKKLTVKKLRDATFNTPIINKALEYTDIVEQFVSKADALTPYMRIQQLGGLMLYHYGRYGDPDSEDKSEREKKGFDILLAVFQKGYGPTKAYDNKPRMEEGTYKLATYVNVQNYSSIFNSIQEELIQFGPGGDGVYINYPGSNQSAKFKDKWRKML